MPRTRKQIIRHKLNKLLINNGLININTVINALKSHNIHKYHITTKNLCYILKNEHIQLSIKPFTTPEKLVQQLNLQILKNSDNSVCNICYAFSCTLILCSQCFTAICEQCCLKTMAYNNGLDICSFCKYTEM